MKKFLSTITAMCIIGTCSSFTASAELGGSMRDITTMELVHDMGRGINIGNTFEACGDWIAQYGDGTPRAYETAWGSPVITKEIVKGYADEGFGSVRIPVAWSNMMANDGSYKINSAWMKRVREVIDWALDDGLYVIMNLHWDGGWLEKLPTDYDNCIKKYSTIWTQLCDEFKDYGDHLIFEAQNEELYWNDVWNQWSGSTNGKDKVYGWCNEVNQKFVDIVRNSGGNNAKRHLLISGYNTDVNLTCDPLFKMPNDPAGRCAVSVHYYIPSTFAILEEDADWGKAAYTWGSQGELNELKNNMNLLKSTFVDKGVPVIIGEYGCPTKNKDPESVRKFISSVCEEAYSRNMCPVLWDTPGLHYDREGSHQIKDKQLKELLDKIVNTQPQNPTEPITEPTTEPVTEPTTAVITEETTKASETTAEIITEVTSTEADELLKGDINMDKEINVSDVVALQKHLVNKDKLTKEQGELADINEDNILNCYDLFMLKKLVLDQ